MKKRNNVKNDLTAPPAWLERILNSARINIDIIDAGFGVRYVDSSWKKRYGDPSGRKCYDYFMGRKSPCPTCGIPKALRLKKTIVEEHLLANEGNRPIEVMTVPFKDKNGEWLAAEINKDISRTKQIEKELEASRAHLEMIVNERTANLKKTNELLERIFSSTHVLIAYLDKKFNFIRVNDAYAKADNRSPESFVGKNHFDLYPHRENEGIFRDVVRTGEAYFVSAKPFVYPDHRERGTTYWDWSLQPVKSSSGAVEGLLFTLLDVTERKVAEENLLKTQKELIDAKRLSDIGALAATVAHELRNPLATIRTAVFNIQRKNDNPAIEKNLLNIERKILESDQIISNLLVYSRLRMPQFQDVYLCRIMDDAIEDTRSRFSSCRVSIHRKCGGFKDDQAVEADPFQIKEVFVNVLNNAFEAFPHGRGSIWISCSFDKDDRVKMIIKDNGAGISTDELQRIEEPFYTTKSSGIGLGLSVCNQMVSLHGGDIGIQSVKRKGTTVTITLPLKRKAHVVERGQKKAA